MSDVIDLNAPFYGDIPVKDMLTNIAKSEKIKNAFILTWTDEDANGDIETSYYSSSGDSKEIIYKLQEYIFNHFNGY